MCPGKEKGKGKSKRHPPVSDPELAFGLRRLLTPASGVKDRTLFFHDLIHSSVNQIVAPHIVDTFAVSLFRSTDQIHEKLEK